MSLLAGNNYLADNTRPVSSSEETERSRVQCYLAQDYFKETIYVFILVRITKKL